jgi:hypothetical protein
MSSLIRNGLLLAAVAAATALGVTAASALAPDDQPAVQDQWAGLPGVAGSDEIAARTGDPDGGVRWAVRTYTNRAGARCADFGQEVGGRIGMVDAEGAFHERKLVEGTGNCADPAAGIGIGLSVTVYPDDPTTAGVEPARTIVHGLAGPRIERVSVEWPKGTELLTLSSRRAFIAVHDGGEPPLSVSVGYSDGTSRTWPIR